MIVNELQSLCKSDMTSLHGQPPHTGPNCMVAPPSSKWYIAPPDAQKPKKSWIAVLNIKSREGEGDFIKHVVQSHCKRHMIKARIAPTSSKWFTDPPDAHKNKIPG